MYTAIDIEAGSIKKPQEGFEIAVKFMFGDADHYTTKTFFYPKELENSVIDLANFLKEYNPRKKEKHPKFHHFFQDESNDKFWLDEPDEEGSYYSCPTAKMSYWPCNWDTFGYAVFNSLCVRYVDKHGDIHNVTLR